MNKYTKVVLIAGLCALFAIGTSIVVFAADYAQRDTDNVFTGVVNWFKKGIKIGEQGVGGVTYFNGTIVNNTTKGGVDNPVTIGDKLRVDDVIYRTEIGGNNHLKFADTLMPSKDNSYSLDTTGNRWKDVYLSGNISQDQDGNGTAKAGVVVGDEGLIYRAFTNLSDSTPAVTATRLDTGKYRVDFGFKVDNRYLVTSPRGTSTAPTAVSGVASGNTVDVYIANVLTDSFTDQAFDIVVF